MGLLEGQALVEDEVVSVGLYLASWRLTEISDEYWTLLDQACVSLNVLYLAGFFSFLRAKPAGKENEKGAIYVFSILLWYKYMQIRSEYDRKCREGAI